MVISKTNEQAFEALIEKALVGSILEERTESVDAQTVSAGSYYWGKPSDFDKKLGFDTRRLWSFLETTQQKVLDEHKGKDLKTELPKQLSKAIDTFGVIDVLRNGFDIDNIHISPSQGAPPLKLCLAVE